MLSESSARGELGNVTIVSKTGGITVGNIDVTTSLDIQKDSGGLSCLTDMTGNMKLSVKSGYGKISVKNVGKLGTSSGTSVNMNEIRNANITFGTIYGDLQYMNGTSGLIRGKEVTGALIVNPTEACVVKIDTIDGNVIFNSNAGGSLYASYVGGYVKSQIKGNGQINIKALDGTSEIDTQNGKVALGVAFKDSIATAFEGVKGNVNITSQNGEVQVKCAASARDVVINVRAKNAFVNLMDVRGTVDYSVIENGKSHIKANYAALSGENKFETTGGAIDLIIPSSIGTNLTWSSERNATIEVSGAKSDAKEGSSSIGTSASSGSLIVKSTTGKITIKNS